MADAYKMNSAVPDRGKDTLSSSPKNNSTDSASVSPSGKIQRVARYLYLLDPKESDSIIRHLPKEDADTIRIEMLKVKSVSPEEQKALKAEFSKLSAGTVPEKKAQEQPPSPASKEKPVNEAGSGEPFAFMKVQEVHRILALCERESAQSIAVMVSFLEPQKSAQVIMSLPPEMKQQVVRRLAAKKTLKKDLVDSVEELFKNKIAAMGESAGGEPFDGAAALAQILKFMPGDDRTRLMEELEAEDLSLGARIKESLFSTDDLIYVDSRGLQVFLEQWNDNDLVYILRDKPPAFVSKIRENVSSRRLVLLDEESDFVGPVRRSEVKERTAYFMDALRKEIDSGRIALLRDDSNDYV